MAEKLTEQQVADLMAILKKDVSVDVKAQQVTAAKSAIKQHNVPDTCVAPLFEALRLASSSQHSALVNAGFTALNHLLTRLSRQEPKYILREAKYTMPLIVEKLGDTKDKFRTLAIQAMTTMYGAAPVEAERFVRNVAMAGKNPRAKESSMQWLVQMHKEHGLQFRVYVPTLMELLEDADGMVRDVAKATVIELFRDSPGAAKSDLKKQLKNFKVRPAIEAAIVKELVPGPATAKRAMPEERPDSAPLVRPRGNLAASVSSMSSERPTTPAPELRSEPVDPAYVNTSRELEDIFRDMLPWFEGKETEQNWLKREESTTKLRKLIAGNVPQDFPDQFLASCKSMLDGIIKACLTLRTSLAKEACALVQDMALAFGPGMDPMVELLMQTFIKLCAATKKLMSQLSNVCVDTILGRCTYNARIMQHIWGACQDKNVQPRTYVTGWLKTLIKKEAHHKNHLDLDLLEKCIKKGLGDANPGVREQMRSTYWLFATVWPARAEVIMENLDSTAQKLLQKDPNNPNSPKKGAEPAARPGMGFSKSTMSTASKPSLRDAMMAQKKALAVKNLPARPGSAMATISPQRPASTLSHSSSTQPSAGASTNQTRVKAAAGHGGMSAAPTRPVRKRPEMGQRPEMAPRPATAGPYAGRNNDGLLSGRSSPVETKSKVSAPKAISGSPRRTAPRPRPGHQPTLSESSTMSPPRPTTTTKATAAESPRPTPVKAQTTMAGFDPSGSPTKADEEFSLVVPSATEPKEIAIPAPEREASVVPEPQEVQEELAAHVEPTTPVETIGSPEPAESAEPEEPFVLVEALEPTEAAEPMEVSEPVEVSEPMEVPEPMEISEPMVIVQPEEANGSEQTREPHPETPSKTLKVYEDPLTAQPPSTSPQPATNGDSIRPVLEARHVNEDAGRLSLNANAVGAAGEDPPVSPDKARQNTRILDSGTARVKSRNLDVHGFRKLQSLIRNNKGLFTDDKFDALLVGLFQYLEAPLADLSTEKIQDVKAQVLATIKLLLKNLRDNFQPHVSRGLEALLATRAAYEARTHIVSGMELLADELVLLGDADEITVTMTRRLGDLETDAAGSRSLGMGLHVLKQVIDTRPTFTPNDTEIGGLASLAARCLESRESGVRMEAVQLCVALHARVGEHKFWECMKGVKDDPKSLITYYVVKRQRETSAGPAAAA
ncbi:clasp N terminal-domain-containing protein [Apiospora marii]|uniref:clasp N terminal-domain-containing protein n=1 Tax=Apiospora marii TaxID=335849 RepID=UPI00312E5E64